MFVLDRLIVGGIKFVLEKVGQVADAELNDVDRLREELLAAQLRLELGEIGEEEFAAIEGVLVTRLREIRQRELDESRDLRPTGVDVALSDDVRWDEPTGGP